MIAQITISGEDFTEFIIFFVPNFIQNSINAMIYDYILIHLINQQASNPAPEARTRKCVDAMYPSPVIKREAKIPLAEIREPAVDFWIQGASHKAKSLN